MRVVSNWTLKLAVLLLLWFFFPQDCLFKGLKSGNLGSHSALVYVFSFPSGLS